MLSQSHTDPLPGRASASWDYLALAMSRTALDIGCEP